MMMTRWMLGLALPVLAAPGLAIAQEDEPAATAEIYACAEVSDDLERLACYDASVGRLKAAEESGDVVTVTRDEVRQVQRESFGFSLPSLPRLAMPSFGGDSEEIEEVVLPVSRVDSTREGLRVYLENGQIWQQIDTTSVYFSRKSGVDEATIKRAALGSFRMQLDNGLFFRAKRVE